METTNIWKGRLGRGKGKDYRASPSWFGGSPNPLKTQNKEKTKTWRTKPHLSLLYFSRPEKNAPSCSRHPTCSTKPPKRKSPGSSEKQLEATPPPAQGHTHAATNTPGGRHCTFHVTARRGQRSVARATKRRGRSEYVLLDCLGRKYGLWRSVPAAGLMESPN